MLRKVVKKLRPTALIITTIFIIFDIATGWLKALSTGTANSSIMRQGLYRKLAEIVAVIFGYLCEFCFPYAGLDVSIPFSTGIATYIVLMETASVIENLAIINPHLAEILDKFFSKEKIGVDDNVGKHEDKSADSL